MTAVRLFGERLNRMEGPMRFFLPEERRLIMEESIPAAEAKTSFGALLEKVQREPLAISKKGRPVAVLMSMH